MENKLIKRFPFILLKMRTIIRFYLNKLSVNKRKKYVTIYYKNIDYSRYLINLIQFFAERGYNVRLVLNRTFWAGLNNYWFKLAENKHVSLVTNLKESTGLFISDKRLKDDVILLDPDYYSSFHIQSETHYRVPFSLHPGFYFKGLDQLLPVSKPKKKFKIVFAGNLNGKYQDIALLGKIYLSRVRLVEVLIKSFHQQIHMPKSKDEIFNTEKPICLINSEDFRLDKEDYVNFLSSAEFGLCPVGLKMPFCHNLIESIYTRTVPILQYNNILIPELRHLKECVSFNGTEEDFVEKINMILSGRIDSKEMAENLISYYESNLSPAAVVSNIEKLSKYKEKYLYLLAGDAGEYSISLTNR